MSNGAVDLQARPKVAKAVSARRTTMYICLILIAALLGSIFKLRTQTILACQASLHSPDQYVAYCNGSAYADYEHGAFALGLEPLALKYAHDADVLFLGNSHLQFAFSTTSTAHWFTTASVSYYLMGFTYYENMVFAKALLQKIHPVAKVYVINVDNFFRQWETPPAREVLTDHDARSLYEEKRLWQRVHAFICEPLSVLCGHQLAFYRSRETGAYTRFGGGVHAVTVTYEPVIDRDVVRSDTANAIDFLSHLPVKRDCVILTNTPTAGTKIANVKAIAKALGMELVAPDLPGLRTFDGSHLDEASAARWSAAFFQAAGPRILSCLKAQALAHE